jgi:hypothetical protein
MFGKTAINAKTIIEQKEMAAKFSCHFYLSSFLFFTFSQDLAVIVEHECAPLPQAHDRKLRQLFFLFPGHE